MRRSRSHGERHAADSLVCQPALLPFLASSVRAVRNHVRLLSVYLYPDAEVFSVDRMGGHEAEFYFYGIGRTGVKAESEGFTLCDACRHAFVAQTFVHNGNAARGFQRIPFMQIRTVGRQGSLRLRFGNGKKYRQVARLVVHDAFPLRRIIPPGKGNDAVESRSALLPVRLSMTGKLGVQAFLVHFGSPLHGILHQLVISVAPRFRHPAAPHLGLVFQHLISLQAPADKRLAPRQIAYDLIFRVFFLRPGVPHKFRLADMGKAVMLLHHREQAGRCLRAELAGKEVPQMAGYSLLFHPVYVPCHVHEQLGLVFGRLDVAHVQNPHLADALVVCCLHLLVNKVRARSGKPQVVVRTPPIRDMVVNAVSARSGSFFFGREMGDVSVIVVTPHQGDVFGHLQPGFVHVQHLLVRYQHLRHFRHFSLVFRQQLALVFDDLGQCFLLVFHGLGSQHAAIVHPAHAQRIDVVRMTEQFHPFFPKRKHVFAVGQVIVFALPHLAPFAVGVAHHRLAMRRAEIDGILVCHFLIAFGKEERHRTLVHRRPERIGTQAEQEFEDTRVGLRAYLPFHVRRLVVGVAPRHQSPILIVDEDAPIGHERIIGLRKSGRDTELLLLIGHNIRPPFPRRYAQHTREFQHPVCRAPLVASGYQEFPVLQDGDEKRLRMIP